MIPPIWAKSQSPLVLNMVAPMAILSLAASTGPGYWQLQFPVPCSLTALPSRKGRRIYWVFFSREIFSFPDVKKRKEKKWNGFQFEMIGFFLVSFLEWFSSSFPDLKDKRKEIMKEKNTGDTPQSDTKESVIFQPLEMIILFWKKILEDLSNRFCLF